MNAGKHSEAVRPLLDSKPHLILSQIAVLRKTADSNLDNAIVFFGLGVASHQSGDTGVAGLCYSQALEVRTLTFFFLFLILASF
jgi:hypothetical protein